MTLLVRYLGVQDYGFIFAKMKAFNDARDSDSPDEIWLLEHHPVFTQGQAGKEEYILFTGDIPVVKSDRGGHVTYHGPGQITAYILVDLKRLKLGVRELVSLIEQALVSTLQHWQITASPRRDAPGVYLENGHKIASLGLRIRKGCSYHGLSLNVDAALAAFERINPCGYAGLEVTRTRDLGITDGMASIADKLTGHLLQRFGYDSVLTAALQGEL